MLFIIVVILFVLLVISLIRKNKGNSFDEYLIQRHENSLNKSEFIQEPLIKIDESKNVETVKSISVGDSIENYEILESYLGMIKSKKYDTVGLRKEAMEEFKLSKDELDFLLKKYRKVK